MSSYIKRVTINIPEIITNLDISFAEGINFISGENGTGKSKVLEFIRANASNSSLVELDNAGGVQPKIAFYNPKRNAVKKEITGRLQQIQREGKTRREEIAKLNQGYNDQGFVEYSTISDLFITAVNETIFSESRTPDYAVRKIGKKFDDVIKMVLPYFELEYKWDRSSQQPELFFKKYGHQITATGLSVGENEILALTLSVFLSVESYDLYLIDEPEVHLNWSLEKYLFSFLEWLSVERGKQIIVTTHSPVVFEEIFYDKTTFLEWGEGNIVASNAPNEELVNTLASRVVKTVTKLEDEYDKTIFVEDRMHGYVVRAIAKIKGKNVNVIEAGSRDKIITLHRVMGKSLGDVSFMMDGDNDEEANSKLTGNIFALKKYCIENYLLDVKILLKISKNPTIASDNDIKKLIVDKVTTCRDRKFKQRYLAHIKLAKKSPNDFFEIIDNIDASHIFSNMKLHEALGYERIDVFVNSYVSAAKSERKLRGIFLEIISNL